VKNENGHALRLIVHGSMNNDFPTTWTRGGYSRNGPLVLWQARVRDDCASHLAHVDSGAYGNITPGQCSRSVDAHLFLWISEETAVLAGFVVNDWVR